MVPKTQSGRIHEILGQTNPHHPSLIEKNPAGRTTYPLHVPILQKRIQHIHLFQLALLVERHLCRYRRECLVRFDVVLRSCRGRRGGRRRFEAGVDAVLEGLLEGDFGAEEVGGPVGEDAEVVLLEYLRRRRGGVRFVGRERKGGGLYFWEVGRGGSGFACLRIWPLWRRNQVGYV